MTKSWETGVSCIVPTFRRPDGLKIALDSLCSQTVGARAYEIIVADNDPAGSAQDFVTKYAEASQVEIVYLHIPAPGVSNARNGALTIARGRFIAWLDDDQEAGPDWVTTLINTSLKYEASLTFCPTVARIPGASKYDNFYVEFFERRGPETAESQLDTFFGCGNSLMDLENCQLPTPIFDPIANETGGEDDMLFTYIQKHGGTFAWTRSCYTNEDIRPHRATPQYVKVRSFAFGQGPSEMAAEEKDILGVIKWMLVGFAQMCIYMPLSIGAKILGLKSYIGLMAKAYMGAGKVFWFGRFKPKLYGQAAVQKKAF